MFTKIEVSCTLGHEQAPSIATRDLPGLLKAGICCKDRLCCFKIWSDRDNPYDRNDYMETRLNTFVLDVYDFWGFYLYRRTVSEVNEALDFL